MTPFWRGDISGPAISSSLTYEWGLMGSIDVFLSDSFDDPSIVWRGGCYVINIPSFPPVLFFPDNLGFSIFLLIFLEGGMAIFPLDFVWAHPRAIQIITPWNFGFPVISRAWDSCYSEPSCPFWSEPGLWAVSWKQTGGKVSPALCLCNIISIHFDIQGQCICFFSGGRHLSFSSMFTFYLANNTLCTFRDFFLTSQGLEMTSEELL